MMLPIQTSDILKYIIQKHMNSNIWHGSNNKHIELINNDNMQYSITTITIWNKRFVDSANCTLYIYIYIRTRLVQNKEKTDLTTTYHFTGKYGDHDNTGDKHQ